MKLVRPLLLASALLLPSSCGVVAGTGLGYVISREVLPGAVHEAHIAADVDQVWPLACESLEIMHDLGTEMTFTAEEHRALGEVDGAQVTIDVLAYDYQRTVVRVEAVGTLADDPATAGSILQNILDRIERESGVREASAR